jgi:hypothetical protein
MDDKKFTPGQQINYKQWYETFVNEYEDFKKWLTNRNFNSWLRSYFEFKKIEIDNVSSNGQRYYEIKSDNPNTKKDENLPF